MPSIEITLQQEPGLERRVTRDLLKRLRWLDLDDTEDDAATEKVKNDKRINIQF